MVVDLLSRTAVCWAARSLKRCWTAAGTGVGGSIVGQWPRMPATRAWVRTTGGRPDRAESRRRQHFFAFFPLPQGHRAFRFRSMCGWTGSTMEPRRWRPRPSLTPVRPWTPWTPLQEPSLAPVFPADLVGPVGPSGASADTMIVSHSFCSLMVILSARGRTRTGSRRRTRPWTRARPRRGRARGGRAVVRRPRPASIRRPVREERPDDRFRHDDRTPQGDRQGNRSRPRLRRLAAG